MLGQGSERVTYQPALRLCNAVCCCCNIFGRSLAKYLLAYTWCSTGSGFICFKTAIGLLLSVMTSVSKNSCSVAPADAVNIPSGDGCCP